MFIAGIDAGGTSARLELRDLNGDSIIRKRFGPLNITGIGEDAYRQRLREIFTVCGNMSGCASVCIGGAGVTKIETGEIVRDELQAAGFRGRLKLCGDHEIALRGAMEGPGCILIAGTGSIAYGINGSGKTARVGGCGHLIDDCGSGYAIGRDALALTVQTLDGRKNARLLTDTILKAIGAEDAAGVVNYVYGPETGKSGIASLAPSVIRLAEDGDTECTAVLSRNSAELVLMAEVLIRKLDLNSPRISLSGGLLEPDNIYRAMTAAGLSKYAEIVPAEHDSLYGAVSLAREALKKE